MSVDAEDESSIRSSRRAVAAYDSYGEAERAVDWLSDEGFPVERVAIVATGLRMVEQVAGRLTTGRAALVGTAQGASIGLLFALLFGLFFTVGAGSLLGVLIYGVIAGAVFGALLGWLSHMAQGGRRDFTSATGMQADRYELQVDEQSAAEAERVLGSLPAATA